MENFNIKRFLSAKLCYVLCVLISCKFGGCLLLKIQFWEFHEIDGQKAEKKATRETFQIRPFSFCKYPKFSKACRTQAIISKNLLEHCFYLWGSSEALFWNVINSECLRRFTLNVKFLKSFLRPELKFESAISGKLLTEVPRNFIDIKYSPHLIGFRSSIENVSCPNPSIHLGTQNLPHLISRKFPFKTVCNSPKSGV